MAGYIIPVVPKRVLDFAFLGPSATQDLILADRVDLLHWREVSLMVHVHANGINAGGSITIGAIAQSWTSAEPETTFLGPEFMASAITASTSSSALIALALPMTANFTGGCMSAMARLIARGLKSDTDPLNAIISVEFAVKDA